MCNIFNDKMVVSESSGFHMCMTFCLLKTAIEIKTTIRRDARLNKPQFHHMNAADFAYKIGCVSHLQRGIANGPEVSAGIIPVFYENPAGLLQRCAGDAHGTIPG